MVSTFLSNFSHLQYFVRGVTFLLLVFSCLAAPADGAQKNERKKVLVLYAFRPTLPVSIQYDRGIRSVFENSDTPQTVLNIEFMDMTHFKDELHSRMLADVYRLKYIEPKPDLIIAVAEPAVEFVLKHREDLFHGVPIDVEMLATDKSINEYPNCRAFVRRFNSAK